MFGLLDTTRRARRMPAPRWSQCTHLVDGTYRLIRVDDDRRPTGEVVGGGRVPIRCTGRRWHDGPHHA